jgi:hypothetical protein
MNRWGRECPLSLRPRKRRLRCNRPSPSSDGGAAQFDSNAIFAATIAGGEPFSLFQAVHGDPVHRGNCAKRFIRPLKLMKYLANPPSASVLSERLAGGNILEGAEITAHRHIDAVRFSRLAMKSRSPGFPVKRHSRKLASVRLRTENDCCSW